MSTLKNQMRRRVKVATVANVSLVGVANLGYHYRGDLSNWYNGFIVQPRYAIRKLISYFPRENPGFFRDFGKMSTELLDSGYNTMGRIDFKTASPASGIDFTQSATIENNVFGGDIYLQLRKKGMVDVLSWLKVTSGDTISGLATFSCEEYAPGLKVCISGMLPHAPNHNHFSRNYFSFNGSVRLLQNPDVRFSAVAGTSWLAVGGAMSFDAVKYNRTGWELGGRFFMQNVEATLKLTESGDLFNASYYHNYSATKFTGEVSHRIRTHATCISGGIEYDLDSLTSLKASVRYTGTFRCLLRHTWKSNCSFTLSAEHNMHDINRAPRLGLVITALIP